MKQIRLLAVAALVVASCSILNPFSGASGETSNIPTVVPDFVGSPAESLWKFAWLSVLLVFIFPAVRAPLTTLWTTILNLLVLPFSALKSWLEAKLGSDSDSRS
jgi:hypothetical protein